MGAKVAASLSKRTDRAPAPIRIEGRAIAKTFWGSAWCKNLEDYSDYANRLPRGRTYARNGSIVDLHITTGKVEALVQGSSLYKIQITFSTLSTARWNSFKQRSSGRVTNLVDLLQGRLSKEILADLTQRDTGLFPAPSEIKMKCSCPDWAGMCKHLAAVLYGVGARLDEVPELFFTLRGVEVSELIASATATAAQDPVGVVGSITGTALEGEDLGALFGVELDSGAPAAVPPPPLQRTKRKAQSKQKPEEAAKAKPPATKARAKTALQSGSGKGARSEPNTRKPSRPRR